MFSGPPRQSYERLDSIDDLSLDRRIAREAAAVAWVLARSGSNGSEVEVVRFLCMERVDFDLFRRSLALRDDAGSILGNICRGDRGYRVYVKYGCGCSVMIGNGYEGEVLQGLQSTVKINTIEQHSRWEERCLQMCLQKRKVVDGLQS